MHTQHTLGAFVFCLFMLIGCGRAEESAPKIVVEPARQTVKIGERPTFAVEARGGELSYQWQKNGSDIKDATAATYTAPAATKDDNGAQFRCVVSNKLGKATSKSAVLLVTTN